MELTEQGPVLAYMKKVTNAAGAAESQGPGGGWFKVAAEGLISSSEFCFQIRPMRVSLTAVNRSMGS